MTLDTLANLIITIGWVPIVAILTVRISQTEQTIKMIMRDTVAAEDALRSEINQLRVAVMDLRSAENQNALDICRIGDAHVDTRSEVAAHARTLDHHTDRLSVLETEQ